MSDNPHINTLDEPVRRHRTFKGLRKPPSTTVVVRVPETIAVEFEQISKRMGVKRNRLLKPMLEDFVRRARAQLKPGQESMI